MKKIVFIAFVALLASCNNQPKTAVTGDPIKDSAAYHEYVTAYNDYMSCKERRPQLTTAYMNKEITAEEFQKELETNTKMCQLQQQIFNTRWKILQAQFDREQLTPDYQLGN